MTAVTVMSNVTGVLTSTPLLAVPPLSWRATVTVATPLASAAGVQLSVPSAAMAGPTLKSDGLLSAVKAKVRTWPLSPGPALMPVAQAALWAVSSRSDTSPPVVKTGRVVDRR